MQSLELQFHPNTTSYKHYSFNTLSLTLALLRTGYKYNLFITVCVFFFWVNRVKTNEKQTDEDERVKLPLSHQTGDYFACKEHIRGKIKKEFCWINLNVYLFSLMLSLIFGTMSCAARQNNGSKWNFTAALNWVTNETISVLGRKCTNNHNKRISVAIHKICLRQVNKVRKNHQHQLKTTQGPNLSGNTEKYDIFGKQAKEPNMRSVNKVNWENFVI